MGRVDARGRRVQGELAHGNAHATGSLIAKTQDTLTIGDDDDAYIFIGPVKQQIADFTPVLD